MIKILFSTIFSNLLLYFAFYIYLCTNLFKINVGRRIVIVDCEGSAWITLYKKSWQLYYILKIEKGWSGQKLNQLDIPHKVKGVAGSV